MFSIIGKIKMEEVQWYNTPIDQGHPRVQKINLVLFALINMSIVRFTSRAIRQLAKVAGAHKRIRISVESGGCNGFKYGMEISPKIEKMDEIINAGDVKVHIDPTTRMKIFGTEIDYNVNIMGSQFVFKNPKATSSCGCGESWN